MLHEKEHVKATSHRLKYATRCMIANCVKGARSRGICKRHGGGKRCMYPNCTRSGQGSLMMIM